MSSTSKFLRGKLEPLRANLTRLADRGLLREPADGLFAIAF